MKFKYKDDIVCGLCDICLLLPAADSLFDVSTGETVVDSTAEKRNLHVVIYVS